MSLVTDVLTTVARLSDFMGIDAPASGSALETSMQVTINAVTKWIQNYTSKTFKKTAYTNEEYTTERGQTLNLKHFPVLSSESFLLERRNSQLNENEWETVDGDYYTVDYDAGIIESMGGLIFYRTRYGYRVSYTAGYDFNNTTTFLGETAAADVEIACWMIAQDIQKNKTKDTAISSERLGDYSVSYGEFMNSMFKNPQAKEILDHYRDEGQELSVLTPLQTI